MRECLSPTELENAALALLSSSTFTRFHKMAGAIAQAASVGRRLRENPELLSDLLERSRDLWRALAAKNRRDLEEVELAVLLALISSTGDSQVLSFLRAIGMVENPSTLWIAALSRRLLREQSVNASVDCLPALALYQSPVDYRNRMVPPVCTVDRTELGFSLSQGAEAAA